MMQSQVDLTKTNPEEAGGCDRGGSNSNSNPNMNATAVATSSAPLSSSTTTTTVKIWTETYDTPMAVVNVTTTSTTTLVVTTTLTPKGPVTGTSIMPTIALHHKNSKNNNNSTNQQGVLLLEAPMAKETEEESMHFNNKNDHTNFSRLELNHKDSSKATFTTDTSHTETIATHPLLLFSSSSSSTKSLLSKEDPIFCRNPKNESEEQSTNINNNLKKNDDCNFSSAVATTVTSNGSKSSLVLTTTPSITVTQPISGHSTIDTSSCTNTSGSGRRSTNNDEALKVHVVPCDVTSPQPPPLLINPKEQKHAPRDAVLPRRYNSLGVDSVDLDEPLKDDYCSAKNDDGKNTIAVNNNPRQVPGVIQTTISSKDADANENMISVVDYNSTDQTQHGHHHRRILTSASTELDNLLKDDENDNEPDEWVMDICPPSCTVVTKGKMSSPLPDSGVMQPTSSSASSQLPAGIQTTTQTAASPHISEPTTEEKSLSSEEEEDYMDSRCLDPTQSRRSCGKDTMTAKPTALPSLSSSSSLDEFVNVVIIRNNNVLDTDSSSGRDIPSRLHVITQEFEEVGVENGNTKIGSLRRDVDIELKNDSDTCTPRNVLQDQSHGTTVVVDSKSKYEFVSTPASCESSMYLLDISDDSCPATPFPANPQNIQSPRFSFDHNDVSTCNITPAAGKQSGIQPQHFSSDSFEQSIPYGYSQSSTVTTTPSVKPYQFGNSRKFDISAKNENNASVKAMNQDHMMRSNNNLCISTGRTTNSNGQQQQGFVGSGGFGFGLFTQKKKVKKRSRRKPQPSNYIVPFQLPLSPKHMNASNIPQASSVLTEMKEPQHCLTKDCTESVMAADCNTTEVVPKDSFDDDNELLPKGLSELNRSTSSQETPSTQRFILTYLDLLIHQDADFDTDAGMMAAMIDSPRTLDYKGTSLFVLDDEDEDLNVVNILSNQSDGEQIVEHHHPDDVENQKSMSQQEQRDEQNESLPSNEQSLTAQNKIPAIIVDSECEDISNNKDDNDGRENASAVVDDDVFSIDSHEEYKSATKQSASSDAMLSPSSADDRSEEKKSDEEATEQELAYCIEYVLRLNNAVENSYISKEYAEAMVRLPKTIMRLVVYHFETCDNEGDPIDWDYLIQLVVSFRGKSNNLG